MSESTAVYRLYDEADLLLYVGVSRRPEARWVEHAADKPWWTDVRKLTIAWYESRPMALMVETRAIEDENPLHNRVAGKLEATAGNCPNRAFRVEDDLWADYKRACEADGLTRSQDLRAHMREETRTWKRRVAARDQDA